jgi:prevent-host-death family protein
LWKGLAMKTISVVEAKRYLSALLERVSKGELVTITRYGVPVARLVPVQQLEKQMIHTRLVERMRDLRAQVKSDTMTVKEMIENRRRS